MKRRPAAVFLALLTALVFAFPSGSVWARSSVWKATRSSRTVYLGGTCHVLRKSDYPLPPEYNAAYAKADAVAFETDLDPEGMAGAQQSMAEKGMYHDRVIGDVLTPKTLAQLKEAVAGYGVPFERLEHFKPGLVLVMLTVLEFQRLGLTQEGVDQIFNLRAKSEGKPRLALETMEEQVGFIASLGEGDEDQFVSAGLKDLHETEEFMAELIRAWKAGDEETLDELLVVRMQKEFPELYENLLARRNDSWMPRIVGYFDTPETELVLVGVAHLVGRDGILARLEKRGFKVEAMEVE